MDRRIIVVIREDLRLHDHPALYQASQDGTVIPLYILDDETSQFPIGEAKKWWLHQNLASFQSSLQSIGGKLWIDKGKVDEVLPRWVKRTNASAVYWNRVYDPAVYDKDRALAHSLSSQGIDVQTFEGALLLPPWTIKKDDDTPYKVYSAFYKALRKEDIPRPVPSLKHVKIADIEEEGLSLKDLGLVPSIPWYDVMESIWDPGEEAAVKRFHAFIKKSLQHYAEGRDYPSEGHHSTLSPYLALGVISVRGMFHTLLKLEHKPVEPFIKQLIWREFSYSVLSHFPQSPSRPLHEKFNHFQWDKDAGQWKRWTEGKTGYPIVDAGMRELWATGFMHNRVRMIAASFLTKHLLLPWQRGAEWFLQTLIDADLANNSMGWQWVAGSGFDSSPYFRIFNPTLQSGKFDEDGSYIRMWVPELTGLPDKYIHNPSSAPKDVLTKANITLGEDYPYPIVDHKAARERALERFNDIKQHSK
ncbi:cryptochrome/photolyase family protein [Bacillus sp. KH172YL63]|uniref:cryptochrome/photolyase family protein n=1 Tax=Bacillus sp. KH172YL63 TaxID=2709784 RepID=UPI0013E46347|nr:deoxyribodipyrimidine photo-lyase [Bacillus sp. KH172YL63]BCB02876.1 deoxyribodipyrimidine photo-lyase [Bacillus sp. KH172YL63]